MSNLAIRVEHLSKLYQIGAAQARHDTFRDQLTAGFKSLFHLNGHRSVLGAQRPAPSATFWALKDVSFEVKEGEVVGIIGRNGAGKSTLLKILSRITEPTEGRATIQGRVGSLLEVGTGFHQELTGRENIYLNGAILGMKKAEIERKFDEIVDFSGVEKFIDTPVKRYSSGMYVRLAFAVAAHLEPEVLIVDEVLAVGDAAFQTKCLGRMGEVAREGRTVLFVSHNMGAIESLCHKVLLLEGGKVAFNGDPKAVIDYYLASTSSCARDSERGSFDLSNAKGRPKQCRPLLRRLDLLTEDDKPLNGSLRIGDPLKLSISFHLEQSTSRADIALGFNNQLGQRILTVSSMFVPRESEEMRVGEQIMVCEIPSMTLVPGEYSILVNLDVGGHSEDWVEDAARFTLAASDYYGRGMLPKTGMIVIRHQWYFQDSGKAVLALEGRT